LAPEAPFLKYDALRGIAEEFLSKYHSTRKLPVPIEEIVEFRFGIDIVPVPGLRANFDVDSFISSDLTEIRVDDYVYEFRRTRYRFSLAHELSHSLIHSEIFKEFSFKTIGDWKKALTAIPEKDYSILEWQANSLGGLILVPPLKLREEYQKAVAKVQAVGLSPSDPSSLDAIEHSVSTAFDVSSAVIHRRIEYDCLQAS